MKTRRGSNRTTGSPALPGAGRKPSKASIHTDNQVFVTETTASGGFIDHGRGVARIERADSGGRLIVIERADGSEIRLLVL